MHDQQFFVRAWINLAMSDLALGIRDFTDEFRHGTTVPTRLVAPPRRKLVAAKVATSAAGGAPVVLVAHVAMLVPASLLIAAKGAEVTLEPRELAALGGAVVAGGLWAALGAAVGAVVRHKVPAVVGCGSGFCSSRTWERFAGVAPAGSGDG